MNTKPTRAELEKRVQALEAENRVQAQTIRALRETEQWYQDMFQNAPLGMFRSTFEGRFLAVNPALADMLGYESPDAVLAAIHDIAEQIYVKTEDREELVTEQKKAADTVYYVNRYRRRDGTEFIANLFLKTIRDDDGQPLYLEGIVEDLSGPMAMHKTLHASERRFRDLVETVPDGIEEVDLEGRIIFVNPAYENMLGCTRKEVEGTYAWDREASAAAANRAKAYFETIKSTQPPPEPIVSRNVTKTGDIIDVRMNWNYKRDDAGALTGFIGVVSDITKRKQQQAALRQSEAFLRTLLDAIPMPVFYKDREGKYLGINRAFEDFFGEPRDRFVGKTVFDINPPEFARVFKQKDDALFESGGEQVYEGRMQTAHGRVREVIFHKAVFRNETGMVAGLIGAILDVTERNRTQKMFRESEDRLALAVEGARLGTWDWNVRTDDVTFNDLWATMKGYDPKDIQPRLSTWENFVHPEDLPAVREKLAAHFEGETTRYQAEFRMRHKSGHWVWVLDTGQVIERDAEGSPLRACGIHLDITDRRQAEEEKAFLLSSYKQKAEEMEALFNGTRLLLEEESFEITARRLFDICRRITGADSGYVALLSDDGAENEVMFLESGGLPCDVNPELPMPIRGLRGEAYAFGVPVYDNDFANSQWMAFMPEGHVHLKNVLFAPLKDNGKAVGLIGLANKAADFTDDDAKIVAALSELAAIALKQSITRQSLKEKEKLLRQTQKLEAIGNLAGGIAHDFNNILFSIMGFTDLAVEEADAQSRTGEYLHEVQVAANRAKDLVKQILTFARQVETVFKPIQVGIVAKEALKLLRSTISTSIEIVSEIQSEARVMGDVTQVHQIFMNLCTNAAQAMATRGGRLTVEIADQYLGESFTGRHGNIPPGDYLEIRISDTGLGISPAHMERIFDPYFTTKDTDQGTGLGLATVHGIVQSYNGVITVDSAIGKGTVFTIYLPVTGDRGERSESTHAPLPPGTERILIVDDEAPLAHMMGQILSRLGYQTTVNTSSPAALEVFYDNPQSFDLVITDMNMPEMTGDRFAVAVMKHRPDIPVILCTGFSHKLTEKQAAALGIKAFIMKPVARQDLARTVRRVLDG